MKIRYQIPKTYDKCDIKAILSKKFLMSGQMIKRLKIYGIVNVNGVHARVVDKVNAGDELYLELGDTDFKLNRDPEIPVIFENEWYAVINKPSGIVTHPTHGHLDDSLITRLSDKTLHPVMRLDRETSGLIIIAKNGYAHNTIHEHGDIKKTYTAVVYGKYEPEEGLIDYPIRRREGSVMIRDCAPDGKESKTLYKTLKYNEAKDISLVEFKLITGRCHQIRCHSTFMGHPLAGDGLYGPNSIDNPNTSFKDSDKIDRIMGRCALHCSNLKFFDPIDEVQREYSCELPQSFIDLFAE